MQRVFSVCEAGMRGFVFLLVLIAYLVSSCSSASTEAPPIEPPAATIQLPAEWTSKPTSTLATGIQPTATWSPMPITPSSPTRRPFITWTPTIKPAVTPSPEISPTPTTQQPIPIDPACVESLADAALTGQKILFDSDREGNREIYLMNLDGSGLTNLTQHPAEDMDHQWSPSGDKISFISDRDGDDDLYIMNSDGSNPTRITNFPSYYKYGNEWSPTGEKIAFIHYLKESHEDIYVVNPDGSSLINLTQSPAVDWHFDWSPDGRKIVFVSYRDGDSEIYVINTDGSGLLQLTNNNGRDDDPAWSPDGDLIVFESNVKPNEVDPSPELPGKQYLYTVSLDGTNMSLLSTDPLLRFSYSPTWSPDGRKIIFADIEWGPGFLSRPFIINVDGTGLIQVPDVRSGGNMDFVWSPDIRRVAVWYGNSGSASFEGDTIMVFNADATHPIYLPSNSVFNVFPRWTDDSAYIVFGSGSDERDQYPVGYGINVARADGTCFTRLTTTTADDNDPILSPP